MEVEVRVAGGMNTCFVSLPLFLIQALESTSSAGVLPPVLAIELRSPSGQSWHLAWSGSASTSSAIEVAHQLADCISLPNNLRVQVKAVSNLPKAGTVSIEPSSVDDWEILELNSELAEEAILKQVGIVYEGMRFPLWLNGHVVMLFLVVSTSPKNSVVQLVPGSEVVVAPKYRKRRESEHQNVQKQALVKEQLNAKALLRVQQEEKRHVHRLVLKDAEIGVVLTSAVFIHPETARKFSCDNLQYVEILPKFSNPGITRDEKDSAHRRGSSSLGKEEIFGVKPTINETSRFSIVRVILSDSVAEGHVMLPQSLRFYLQAGVHSWVYVKKYNIFPEKDAPLMRVSPCRFKFAGHDVPLGTDGLDDSDNHMSLKNKKLPLSADLYPYANVANWSLHEDVLTYLSKEFLLDRKETFPKDLKEEAKKLLIKTWFIGQLKAIGSLIGPSDASSVLLSQGTVLHFELKSSEVANDASKQLFSDCSNVKRYSNEESAVELLYLLTATFEEAYHCDRHSSYELALKSENKSNNEIRHLELAIGKLDMVDPVSVDSIVETNTSRSFNLSISSISWMETAISDVISRLTVLVSPYSGKLLNAFGLPLPGHVLIYGPPGSGKTSLLMAVANYFEKHEEILAHIVFVSCSKLALEKGQTIRQAVKRDISEALAHSPSIVVFDDLDRIVSVSSELEASQSSNSVTALVRFFTDILDDYEEKHRSVCGFGPIAFIASVQSLAKLPQSLSSSGRFDFHIEIPAPSASERRAMLKHEIGKRILRCEEDVIADVASKCDGYNAHDLEILVDRAVHAALSHSCEEDKFMLVMEDFSRAMHGFVPVAMRGLTKAAAEDGCNGWEDVGGLINIRSTIQEMLEMPVKYPNIFKHAPLRLRSNILLYGPPGCGKTHIVRAAATACSLGYITVKGPELLNKYIGASEQAVRDLFSKAAAAAPCILFFDEFDSIAPKRGHDNTGVTDRVVNQLLTELDGVEVLTGVFVFAATSRPDLLDRALLRPGRLDRHLFCDFPSWQERLDILTVLSRKLHLASNVNLGRIASMTEGFSGADLQLLLSDAQLASVEEVLNSGEGNKSEKQPIISDEMLVSAASKTRRSVSEAERHKLNAIYSEFMESKKSVTAQSQEAKGKRATLA